MFKKANKWLKETIRPYKYEDQKTRDKEHLIAGVVNFVVGTIKLLFKLINLMLIVPIKALIADQKNFAAKYKEIGQSDITTIVSTFQQTITGLAQLLTSPILPFRIILRLFLTPKDGVSVFINNGLKTVVNEYLKNTPEPHRDGIRTFALVKENDLPDNIKEKAEKYNQNKQKDNAKLSEILAKPTLTYYKMREIKTRIEQETRAKDCKVNSNNRI